MGAFDNAMNKTVSAVKDIMGVAADKFMNIPGVGPLAKFVGSTASGVMSALNNGVKFLLNLLFAGLRKLIDLLPKGPKGFLDKAFNYAQGILPPPGSNELMDKFTNAMPAGFMKSGKMQDLVGQPGALQNALQGSAPALVGMSQQSQEFTATSSGGGRPSKRRRLAKRSEDLHEGVGAEHAHDGGAGSSGNPLKDGMKDFLQQVVTNALSKGIDIPIITPLWKWITKGQDLSLQNFQGLLVAIPSVLVHKIATNKAPVSDVASLTNWNADQLLAFFKSQAEKG